MADAEMALDGLASAAVRFPDDAAALFRLSLTSPGLREVCEEYALARQSLARFEARADAADRPEIGEYRTLIAELEVDIRRILEGAAGTG